jgi:D-tyrosyl-tRNA(Tyr) deacylase
MKLVIQRVASASVTVDGAVRASIDRGLLVLAGLTDTDADADLEWCAGKVAELRIFEDEQGKMNRSVAEVGGAVLLVPNFTLAGDARKGRRPSFDRAMKPELAAPAFDRFAAMVAARGVPVQTGVFRAHMNVSLVNDGPVTILLDSASR